MEQVPDPQEYQEKIKEIYRLRDKVKSEININVSLYIDDLVATVRKKIVDDIPGIIPISRKNLLVKYLLGQCIQRALIECGYDPSDPIDPYCYKHAIENIELNFSEDEMKEYLNRVLQFNPIGNDHEMVAVYKTFF